MDIEQILRIDLMPFPLGLLAEEMEVLRDEDETNRVRFFLFLRYLERFSKECGLDLSIPVHKYVPRGWNKVTDTDQSCMLPKGFVEEYCLIRNNTLLDLLAQVFVTCGWEVVYATNRQNKFPFTVYSARRVTKKEWQSRYKLFSKNPLFPKTKFVSHIYLCWNERIGAYLHFLESNGVLVDRTFGKEASLIKRLLRKIADPLGAEIGTELCHCGERDYQMAFYEGRYRDNLIHIKDIDYNFFIHVVVLDLLVKEAEKKFGYLEKEDVA